jgi:hypothetical protein
VLNSLLHVKSLIAHICQLATLGNQDPSKFGIYLRWFVRQICINSNVRKIALFAVKIY